MKNFFNSDLSLSISAADVDGFMAAIKAHGLKAGKKPVAELLEGKRDEVAGFYFVDELSTAAVEETVVEEPGITEETVAAAVEEALATGSVEVQTTKKLTEEPTKAAVVRVKAVIKASAPKGKIKPVRKGTKIAIGLEMLAGGTTEAALLGVCGDDPVDFCNRRVTKRGYGVALTDGSLSLVFPEGVTAIVFSGS